ncbi:Uncharacterized protein HZ326_16978 [Fusarium oxysporum f. sp. albedinis]|nr:Uncharacterized protein HZ326_16978 [Fusarium oxysporum f. sp. albedinis]
MMTSFVDDENLLSWSLNLIWLSNLNMAHASDAEILFTTPNPLFISHGSRLTLASSSTHLSSSELKNHQEYNNVFIMRDDWIHKVLDIMVFNV